MAKIEPQSTAKGILFTINVGTATHQCLISKKALYKLSQLKNIDASDADAMDVFKAFESYIRPVAQDLFKTRRSLKPIRMTSESITSAFESGVRH